MIEVTFILPKTDNDGVSLTAEITGILRNTLKIAGGYSLVQQSGAWEDETGKVYLDNSTRVTTVVDADTVAKLRELMFVAAVVLRQEAIFFQTRPVTVEFIVGDINKTEPLRDVRYTDDPTYGSFSL